MPTGFKNSTDGSVGIAIDACRAASQPHVFLSVGKEGLSSIVETEASHQNLDYLPIPSLSRREIPTCMSSCVEDQVAPIMLPSMFVIAGPSLRKQGSRRKSWSVHDVFGYTSVFSLAAISVRLTAAMGTARSSTGVRLMSQRTLYVVVTIGWTLRQYSMLPTGTTTGVGRHFRHDHGRHD